MKLYHSPASPYVRKVMVVAQEAGLLDRIEVATVTTTPMAPDAAVAAANPVKKIPALVTDDGMALFDSPVICEYLDSLNTGRKLFPDGKARWEALCLQAAADGLLDSALLVVYESRFREEAMRNQAWVDGQLSKIDGALDAFEAAAGGFGDRVDIGTISVGCSLGYIDFRLGHRDWRGSRPKLAAWYERFSNRPAMAATKPPAA
jgi:glutathione S-transferase